MKDPDPFDERHPSRIDTNCPLGQILKIFFKKEPLVAEIFNNYLRDNYFTRLGQVRILGFSRGASQNDVNPWERFTKMNIWVDFHGIKGVI